MWCSNVNSAATTVQYGSLMFLHLTLLHLQVFSILCAYPHFFIMNFFHVALLGIHKILTHIHIHNFHNHYSFIAKY